MILKTKNENFKKYWLASVQTLFGSQKWHSDLLLTKKFLKVILRPKSDSKN